MHVRQLLRICGKHNPALLLEACHVGFQFLHAWQIGHLYFRSACTRISMYTCKQQSVLDFPEMYIPMVNHKNCVLFHGPSEVYRPSAVFRSKHCQHQRWPNGTANGERCSLMEEREEGRALSASHHIFSGMGHTHTHALQCWMFFCSLTTWIRSHQNKERKTRTRHQTSARPVMSPGQKSKKGSCNSPTSKLCCLINR
jgi:hypothetical protein